MQNKPDLSCLDGVFSKTPAEIIINHLSNPDVKPKEKREFLLKFLNTEDGLGLSTLTNMYKGILDLEAACKNIDQRTLDMYSEFLELIKTSEDNKLLFEQYIRPSLTKILDLISKKSAGAANELPEIFKFINEDPEKKAQREDTFSKIARYIDHNPTFFMLMQRKQQPEYLLAIRDLTSLKSALEYAFGVAVLEKKIPGLNLSQPMQSSKSDSADLNESRVIDDGLNTSFTDARPRSFFGN